MKIIFDTNIYFSGFGFDGVILNLIHYVLSHETWLAYTSPELRIEIERKILSPKFDLVTKNKIPQNEKKDLLFKTFDSCITVITTHATDICRDSDDNMLLNLAKTVEADFLITGDKDLLILTRYNKCQILKPSDFIELMKLDFHTL